MSRKQTSTHSEIDAIGLEEARKLVEQVVALVGTVPALSPKDRTRSLKLRKGGETVIPTVTALSDQFGLSIVSHPTTTMVEGAKKAQSLIPLYKQLVQAAKQVADQMFTANSTSWSAATVHYTMLRRLAKTNGDLQEALVPVNQFFAQKKTKKDAESTAEAAAADPAPVPTAPSPSTAMPTPSAPASASRP
jgi:hypothetical protein